MAANYEARPTKQGGKSKNDDQDRTPARNKKVQEKYRKNKKITSTFTDEQQNLLDQNHPFL